jgi:hypothetical protein
MKRTLRTEPYVIEYTLRLSLWQRVKLLFGCRLRVRSSITTASTQQPDGSILNVNDITLGVVVEGERFGVATTRFASSGCLTAQ